MIPREMMAPLMFGGLVVFMLIGFPVTFSLAAVGLFFGFMSVLLTFQGRYRMAAGPVVTCQPGGMVTNDTPLASAAPTAPNMMVS